MSELNYNCTDIELLLCDYVDSVLSSAQKDAFDRHIQHCVSCAELVRDSTEAIQFVERCATVEPPQELLTRIMHEFPASQQKRKVRSGFSGTIARWFEPILQPRFAMGMAMTILSFSMLGKFVGPVKPLKPSDLDPVKIVGTVDDKLHRMWNDAVKYYESLRVVYEIQTRLREWNQEEEQARQNESQQPQKSPASSNSGEKK